MDAMRSGKLPEFLVRQRALSQAGAGLSGSAGERVDRGVRRKWRKVKVPGFNK